MPENYSPTKDSLEKDIRILLDANIYISDSREIDSAVSFIRNIVYSYKSGTAITVDTVTSKLKSLVLDKETKLRLPVLVCVNVGGKRDITLRIPKFNYENIGQSDNLATYLHFVGKMLDSDPMAIKVIEDETLGTDVVLPAAINTLISSMLVSVNSQTGEFPGSSFKQHDLQVNLVEALAAIRLLKQESGRVRSKPRPRGKDGKVQPDKTVTQEMLRVLFNEKSGIAQLPKTNYGSIVVRSVLSELTKVNFKNFPGKWIHSLKERNSVNTSSGVLAKMGWVPIAPDLTKLGVVISTIPKGDKDISLVTRDLSKKDEPSYGEYRTAVFLTLPFITPNATTSIKDQLADPMKVNTLKTLQFFDKNREIVDASNLAYAIKAAVSSKQNKTAKPLHFKNAKDRLVSLSANKEYFDALGNTYRKYRDIPEDIRKYLEKHYHKSEGVKAAEEAYLKRKTEEPHESEEMETDVFIPEDKSSAPESYPPLQASKKVKVSKK